MPQFLVTREALAAGGRRVRLDGGEARHCVAVLRCGVGDEIHLTDGCGSRWRGTCVAVADSRLDVELVEPLPGNEPPLTVELVHGLPKGDRWEAVLEKGTELGVRAFRPVYTERSVPRLPPPRLARRMERWREKVRSALKQCERGLLPELAQPLPLGTALQGLGTTTATELRLYLAERAAAAPWPDRAGVEMVRMAVGPEGGWAPQEQHSLERAGFHPVSVGPRILRTDTAAVVGIALALARWGDLVCRDAG